MRKRFFRTAVLLTAMCLCLCLALQPALAAKNLSKIIDIKNAQFSENIDTTLSCDEAFSRGNALYAEANWADAKQYYLLALQKIRQSKLYYQEDVFNNLVLTLLHLEENETAYDLSRYMLENQMGRTQQDRFGYMMNLLVCAHANGIPAVKELSDAAKKGYFKFSNLAGQEEKDPGAYSKLLTGLIYNVLYMDMEEDDVYRGVASYHYLSQTEPEDLSMKDLMQQLAKLAGGRPDPKDEKTGTQVREGISRTQYLEYVREFLFLLDEWNEETFDEPDPDIIELVDYLEALIAQES